MMFAAFFIAFFISLGLCLFFLGYGIFLLVIKSHFDTGPLGFIMIGFGFICAWLAWFISPFNVTIGIT